MICSKCFKEIIEGENHYCHESYYNYIKRRLREDLERNKFETRTDNSWTTRNRKDNNTS